MGKARRQRRNVMSVPAMEILEPRTLLTVGVSVVGSDLVVTADAAGDTINITRSGDTYSVNGSAYIATGNVMISSGGGDDDITFTNVSVGNSTTGKRASIFVDLGDGNDSLTLRSVVAANLSVSKGAGQGQVLVMDAVGGVQSNFSGNVFYAGGSGQDVLNLVGPVIGGKLTMYGGEGTNVVLTNDSASNATKIAKQFTFVGGSEQDTLILQGHTIINGMTAVLGEGPSSVNFGNAGFINPANSKRSNLSITGGGGDDNIQLVHVLAASLTLDLGGGSNVATLNSNADGVVDISQAFSYKGGAGNDTMILNGTQIGGKLTVSAGDGSNLLQTSLAGSTGVRVGGKLTYTGGADNDSLNLTNNPTVLGGVFATLGEGTNQAALIGTSLMDPSTLKRGKIVVIGGSGQDSFLANEVVAASAAFNLGAGTNFVTMTQMTATPELTGALSVVGGAGVDTVSLSGTQIGGKCTLSLGDGDNTFITNNGGGIDPSIGGKLSYTGGSGADNMTLEGSLTIGGGLTAVVGDGANFMAGTNILVKNAAGKFANVKYTGGKDNDQVNLSHLEAAAFSAVMGDGTNSAILQKGSGTAAVRLSSLSVIGGKDNDTSYLMDGEVSGKVSMSLGDGQNFGYIFAAGGGVTPQVGGAFSYKGGVGVDSVLISKAAMNGKTSISTGAGNDLVTLPNDGLTFRSKVSVLTGAGADVMNVQGVFQSSVLIDGGKDTNIDSLTTAAGTFPTGQPVVKNIP